MEAVRRPGGVARAWPERPTERGGPPPAAFASQHDAAPLLEPLELSDGDTMLVVGGTGGVGSFAIQIARARGAVVVAPGLPEDEDYLRGLGAEVVDARG